MALKVELKPHERIIIGNCVITNTDQRARLLIDGEKIPILREKDILTPETADTPAKLIYLAVQLMYISPEPQVNHGTYFNLVRELVTVAPSAWPLIENINTNLLNGELYHALKEAKKLVAYEKRLLDSARDKQGATPSKSGALPETMDWVCWRLTSPASRRAVIRRSPRAEFKHRSHKRIEITCIRAVIDDGGTDRELSIERRGRRRRNSGLVDVSHDLAVDAIGSVRTITEADDIELGRRHQFQPRLR